MVMKKWKWGAFEKVAYSVIGTSATRLLSQLNHWRQNKGDEWLAIRWKAIHNAAYLVRNGQIQDAIAHQLKAGISLRPGMPFSKGPFGILQIQFCRAQKPFRIRQVDMLLRGYTGLQLKKISLKQSTKFRRTVNQKGKPPGKEFKELMGCMRKSTKHLCAHWPDWKLTVTHDVYPKIHRMSGNVSYFSSDLSVPKAIRNMHYGSAIFSALTSGYVPPSLLDGEFPDSPIRKSAAMYQQWYTRLPGHLGRIVIIQEGGCKGRMVVVPSFWVQYYMHPLQQLLESLLLKEEMDQFGKVPGISKALQLRYLGMSCVFDQASGLWWLKKWMTESEELFSFDLSAATDRFPLKFQLQYLQQVGLGHWSERVKDVARGQYYVPSTEETWTFACGQPLGTNFSFDLFHLTHLSLLRDLAARYNHHERFGPDFLVLGDDVIIRGSELAWAYRYYMEGIGIDFSEGKSLFGKNVQTFSGGTGVRANKHVTTYRPFRFGPKYQLGGREVSLLHHLGPKVRTWSKKWARDFNLYLKTIDLRNPELSPIWSVNTPYQRRPVPDSLWFSHVTNRILTEYPILPQGGREVDWPREWATLLREKEVLPLDRFQPNLLKRRIVVGDSISRDPLLQEELKLLLPRPRNSLPKERLRVREPWLPEADW